MLFCDTSLAKCNPISICTCVVPGNEVKKLISLIDKGYVYNVNLTLFLVTVLHNNIKELLLSNL